MAFKHYDVVRAASPSDLAEKLTHKLKEGWQPFGSPVAITPYTLMQAIAAEGDVVVSGATEPEWYYVIVLAGQSNAMAYGEGLPLPDSYDAPHPRIKQLARRNTVTPGGKACAFNDIIPADHCLHDVQDIWTICRGAILVDGKPVVPGMKLSKEKCDRVNAIERDKALAWVEKNIKVPLTEPQKAGIASFCPYNIGPGKCFPSTFYKRINAGDRRGACEAIRWWIKDGGRDCRIRSNNCYGQVSRRDQESALACWGIDK